jgi:hypothetical protein
MNEVSMEKLSQIWRRLRFFFRYGQMDHDLAEEMQLHLELKEEEKKAAGFDEEEARLAARREFGNPMLLREASREMWGWTTIESILQDLRYVLRMLLKNPGFSFVAILTLALGIGANSAIFSVVDGFFLRSLPVKNPHELVWIKAQRQGQSHEISYLDYQDICRQSTAFSGIAAVSGHGAMLNMGGETELVRADWVSENHFSFLGLNAALGRTFVAGEDWSQYKTPPVVISTGLWKRRFGADPEIIGKTVILNSRDALILGVAPRWFTGLLGGVVTEVWFPCNAWTSGKDLQSRENTDYWELLGRLKPGIREEKARAELDTIAYRLAEVSPSTNKGLNFLVEAESERAKDKLMLPFFFIMRHRFGFNHLLRQCFRNDAGPSRGSSTRDCGPSGLGLWTTPFGAAIVNGKPAAGWFGRNDWFASDYMASQASTGHDAAGPVHYDFRFSCRCTGAGFYIGRFHVHGNRVGISACFSCRQDGFIVNA